MTTQEGGCHCGKVRFSATGDFTSAIACNCSHCQIKGLVLSFVPKDQFSLTQGEDSLADYYFNQHQIRHRFCSTCGVEPFGFGKDKEGNETVAINLRCLDGNFFDTVVPAPFDGRSY